MSEQELMRLAERCEAAMGADRELDARIWCACTDEGAKDWQDLGEQRWSLLVRHAPIPAYSTSLDAAMTLPPQGWDKGVQDMGEDGFFAEVWRHGYHDDTVLIAHARSTALALCAAALRARAQVQS